MTDEEKIICNDIEKMLISIENKVDWIIEIRRLIDNMNKQNKNIIIQAYIFFVYNFSIFVIRFI